MDEVVACVGNPRMYVKKTHLKHKHFQTSITFEAMSEINAEGFHSVLEIVKRAKNDSEKFASLLVVCKLLKADSLSTDMRRKVFDAIGVSFPLRLIKSDQDSNNEMIVNLGISVMSSFTTNQKFVNSPELLQSLPKVLSIFEESLNTPHVDDNPLFMDCLQIISSSCQNKNCCVTIIRNNGMELLCHCYTQANNDNVKNIVWMAILHLVRNNPTQVLENKQSNILDLLHCASQSIKDDNTVQKFELISQLSAFLEIVPKTCEDFCFSENWISLIVDSLFDVLGSRVSKNERIPALTLCGSLTRLYGLKWIALNTEKHHKFVVLLTRLATIEVKMVFYEESCNEKLSSVSGEALTLLLTCFSILEGVCSCIADFDQGDEDNNLLTFDDIKCVDPSLSETAKVVSDILLSFEGKEDFVLVCMRFLGSWLNVQHFASSKTGIEIANTFITTLKSAASPANTEMLLNICTPAIVNYVESPETLEVIRESKVVTLLCDSLFQPGIELDVLLLTSQCLTAYAVESKQCDELSERITEIFQLVLDRTSPEDIVLKLTIAVLVLIVWNKSSLKFSDVIGAERFFLNILSTLHQLHSLNGKKIKTSKRYQTEGESVKQIFPILMQEFIKLTQDEKVFNIVVESTFPSKVKTIVDAGILDGDDVVHAYQQFFKSVCKR